MKNVLFAMMLVVAAMSFVGCKKDETPGDKLDKAINKADKEAAEMSKKLDKILDE